MIINEHTKNGDYTDDLNDLSVRITNAHNKRGSKISDFRTKLKALVEAIGSGRIKI